MLHVCWLDVLAEFKYTVEHIQGKLIVADPLTRQYRLGALVSGAAGTSELAAVGAAFACAVLSGLPTSAPRQTLAQPGSGLFETTDSWGALLLRRWPCCQGSGLT